MSQVLEREVRLRVEVVEGSATINRHTATGPIAEELSIEETLDKTTVSRVAWAAALPEIDYSDIAVRRAQPVVTRSTHRGLPGAGRKPIWVTACRHARTGLCRMDFRRKPGGVTACRHARKGLCQCIRCSGTLAPARSQPRWVAAGEH